MALNPQPNSLESAFIQRDLTNTYYDQINISGSDLIIYHDSDGNLTADKVSIWASHYGIGSGGSPLSSSWASSSLSSSYALTASYVIGGGGSGISTTVSYIKGIKWNGVVTGSMVFVNGLLTAVT